MSLLQISIELTKENKILEGHTIRLESYIFSSKIRPYVFGYKFNKERELIISDLIKRLNNALDNIKIFLPRIVKYYNEIKYTKIFIQKKHRSFAKRFAYNAISNTTFIERDCIRIIRYLEIIQNNQKDNTKFFHSIKKEFEEILQYFKENNILLSDIQGRIQIEDNLVSKYRKLKNYLINISDLETGDILLLFKSKKDLSKHPMSRAISFFSDSQVTSTSMAVKGSFGIKTLGSKIIGGIKFRDLNVKNGEVLIVLRPKITHQQRFLILESIRKLMQLKTKFSWLKIWGGLHTNILTKSLYYFNLGHIHIPNILGFERSKLYCSEFLNQVFMNAGILLVPKSRNSNVVYPYDLVYSPLKYLGLLFNDNEKSEEKITGLLSDVNI